MTARGSGRGFAQRVRGKVRQQFLSRRQWLDRVVVLAYAAMTGLVVVGFTLLADAGSSAFSWLTSIDLFQPWFALAWTPLLTLAIVWLTRRFAPGTAGSGIPQVVRALDDELQSSQRSGLVSLTVSLQKIALISGGLLAGLSIGREGPTVQVGAGVMSHARRWLCARSDIDSHDLMVAGAAAGIAAAFNTPLGGIVFAFEQLTRRRGMRQSALVISSIVLSGLVSVSYFGNVTYFGKLQVQEVSWALFAPGLMVCLLAGIAGGMFSRLIILSTGDALSSFGRWRSRYPLRFAAGCALVVATIGIVTGGSTAGAGYASTREMLEGRADLPLLYTILKICATWLSVWTGVPAGVFAPSLTIGAGIGHDVSTLLGLGRESAIPLIALGMVAFLAATTQGPITAFIIVMEMISGQSMVLSLMACALLSSAVSRLVARPMYSELAALIEVPLAPHRRPKRSLQDMHTP